MFFLSSLSLNLTTILQATVRDVAVHAGLTAVGDWRNRDIVSIAKVAEVVSLDLNFLVYFSLHITKAKSRNKQLRHYEGNWATYEILKRFFKSKRCYKKRITSVDDDDDDLDSKDMISKDDDVIESNGESDDDGNGDDEEEEADGNGDDEEEADGNKEGEGNGNREGEESGNGDDDGDGGEDDDDGVDSRKGKGKGKAKEGTTGLKRKMPEMVRKSKRTRL
jgi:hypothetical protein